MYQEDANMREIRRGEIYFIDLSDIDYTDSHIAGKSRPGLVIQNNVGNDNSDNVIIALFTSADKKPYPFQYKMSLNGRPTTIMFDQLITISKQNLQNKMGELTNQQVYESDLALMHSLNLLSYSISAIKDFDITHIITERTKSKEITYCTISIISSVGEKENISIGTIFLDDLSAFDKSIDKDSSLDDIKSKMNNCAGLNFIANHIQF